MAEQKLKAQTEPAKLPKRQRSGDATSTPAKKKPRAGFLSGVKVVFVLQSIPHAQGRVRAWTAALTKHGGEVAENLKQRKVTHCIFGELPVDQHLKLRKASAVSTSWLEACLARGARQPEAGHLWTSPVHITTPGAGSEDEARNHGKFYHYRRWLGHWTPEYDKFEFISRLVLQAKYGPGLPENQPIAKALSQLAKFEGALAADYNSSGKKALDGETFNRRAMLCARVAAVVKACSFVITADLATHDIPYGGDGMVARIHSILDRGSTDDLDAHRSGGELATSKGFSRGPDACGGEAKYIMSRLQGVGPREAATWYSMGLRTVEDVVREVQPGGLLGPESEHKLNVIQAFSVQHHADLLADVPVEDVAEIRETVMRLLTKQTGPGWVMVSTGGERRGKAAHDADFLLFHPTRKDNGRVMRTLAEALISRGRLVPQGEGYCAIQDGKNGPKPKKGSRLPGDKLVNSVADDRHDRVLGIFITRSGRMRRTDLVMCPWRERAFALLGWTGSRQYMRFLRQHAGDCGMKLSSHSLMVSETGKLVPYESPPLNGDGQPWWPLGWDSTRAVETEEDIFELLGLPYREPHERQA